MMKPQLLHSKDGKLYLQLSLGSLSVYRPTPEAFPTYTPDAIRTFLNTIVPGMRQELVKLRAVKQRKLRRKFKA